MKDDELKLLYKHIGSLVRKHREILGKSQFHFGLEVGRSANQIGRIERAEGNPTVDTLYNIAKYIDIDIQEFFKSIKDNNNGFIINRNKKMKTLSYSFIEIFDTTATLYYEEICSLDHSLNTIKLKN